MSDNIVKKNLKDSSILQKIGLIVIILLFMTTLLDIKSIMDFLKDMGNDKEGYENYLKDELKNYRSPNVEGSQNQADLIGKYKNYISDYTVAMEKGGYTKDSSPSGVAINGLDLNTNAGNFLKVNKSMKDFMDMKILNLLVNGRLNPGKPDEMKSTIKKINKYYKFRQNAIINNDDYISSTQKSAIF